MKSRMGHRLLRLVCIAASTVCLAVSARAASVQPSGLPMIQAEGVTTTLTTTGGRTYTVAGYPDAAQLENCTGAADLAAYTVYVDGRELMGVTLHDIAVRGEQNDQGLDNAVSTTLNGYYAVTFSLGENDRYSAFLTGLTASSLATLQSENLDAALNSRALEIVDISFIDTEKEVSVKDDQGTIVDSDRDLCWAAATSNILHYTGWGEQAGFGSADYLMDCFTENFTDAGGNVLYGTEWFFDGYYAPQASGWGGWAVVDAGGSMAYGTFGGFLPQYCSNTLIEAFKMEDPMELYTVFERLESGYGVNLNFGYYYAGEGTRSGGHAITLWGYVLDTQATGQDNCHALIVSDSDNNKTYGDNRRTAPNCLSYRTVSQTNLYGLNSWDFDCYSSSSYKTIIDGFVALAPYDPSIEQDTGTNDLIADADLRPDSVELLTIRDTEYSWTVNFAGDDSIYVYPSFANAGNTTGGEIEYRVQVVSPDGSSVFFDQTESFSIASFPRNYITDSEDIPYLIQIDPDTPLAPGSYRLLVTVDPDHTVSEAYEGNNTYETTFTVANRRTDDVNDTLTLSEVSVSYPSGYNMMGQIDFSFSGSLGYAVRQYLVQVSYDQGYYWEDLYRGTECPTSLNWLRKNLSSTVDISVWALPLDGTQGYEKKIGEASLQDLAYIEYEITEGNNCGLSIHEGDTSFEAGETFQCTIHNISSTTAKNCLVLLEVYNPDEEIWTDLAYQYCSLVIDQTDTISFHNFNYLASGYSLPMGDYWVYAYVYYAAEGGYYQNYKGVYLGDLTVFADSYRFTGGTPTNITNITDTSADIGFSFATPDTDFTVQICYSADVGTEIWSYWQSKVYSNWDSGQVEGSIKLTGLTPETDYSACVVKVYAGTDTNAAPVLTSSPLSFTTAAASGGDPGTPEPPAPPTPSFTTLSALETEADLDYGEMRYYQVTPGTDGTWLFTFTGPDGTVEFLGDDGWSAPVYFGQRGLTDGTLVPVPVTAGTPVRLRVQALVSGNYTITCPALDFGFSGDGATLTLTPGQSYYVAGYALSGRMTSAQKLTAGADGTLVIPAAITADARTLRVFCLDGSCQPVTAYLSGVRS